MTLIDTRGLRCPWPAIRVGRALREGAPLPIDILADDPRAEAEIAAIADAKHCTLAKIETGHFRLFSGPARQ